MKPFTDAKDMQRPCIERFVENLIFCVIPFYFVFISTNLDNRYDISKLLPIKQYISVVDKKIKMRILPKTLLK